MNGEPMNYLAGDIEQMAKAAGTYLGTRAWRSEGSGRWHIVVTVRDPETGSAYEIDITKRTA